MLLTPGTSLDQAWSSVVHELNRGALDRKHPFRFISLATISNQKPGVRYVVLRKVDEALNCYIYTDSRSAKVTELQQNPSASILCYHPSKRVQIRMDGQVTLHQQDELSKTHWTNVQGEGRKAYSSTLAPGLEISENIEAYHWHEAPTDENFTVINFRPITIEVLQLNKLEHLRAIFQREEDGWNKKWLVP